MCGIIGIFGSKLSEKELRQLIVKLGRRLRHRGPDRSGVFVGTNSKDGTTFGLIHERLAINDISDEGRQPFTLGNIIYVANGECYNYKEIKESYSKKSEVRGQSDSQAIGIVYNEQGIEGINRIQGMFAGIIYDSEQCTYYGVRDHVGIIPLYIGVGMNGERIISSELKGLWDQCTQIDILRPGHYISSEWIQRPWYRPQWHNIEQIPLQRVTPLEIREKLTQAVKSHLMGDVPFGIIISGGLDSSLIAAIAMRLVRSGQVSLKSHHMEPEVHSFCIGLENSPDLQAAKKVANFLGTKHHEIVFSVQEGIDAIDEVIYHVETFNSTTIRASTPLYLMSRIIKSLGIKILLSGEGADEIFGGYLYFHKAPNKIEFHQETVRKVNDLHKYDLLRGNKATMAWGVEMRPPFLDKEFLEFSMGIDPALKMTQNNPRGIEKYILREAFNDPENPYIPDEILWRQKEQFSDGVGYQWIDSLKELTNRTVTEDMWNHRESTYPISTPFSKEMYLYRTIFESHFPNEQCVKTVPYNRSVACSTEHALSWDSSFLQNADESGRAVLGVHTQSEQLKDAQQHDVVDKQIKIPQQSETVLKSNKIHFKEKKIKTYC